MTFAFYNGLTKGSEVRFMRKILLVDDNSAIAQELAKLLKRRGYGVQIAATVAGAKEVIEKESPLLSAPTLISRMAPAWSCWTWFGLLTLIFYS